MKEINPLVGAAVFGTAFATDVLSVLYVRRSTEGKAVQAAVISAASLVLGAITFYAFVENPLYVTFEASGAALGTYLTVKYDSRKTLHVKSHGGSPSGHEETPPNDRPGG